MWWEIANSMLGCELPASTDSAAELFTLEQNLGRQILTDLGDISYRIKKKSGAVWAQCRNVTRWHTDRQTDRQTDRPWNDVIDHKKRIKLYLITKLYNDKPAGELTCALLPSNCNSTGVVGHSIPRHRLYSGLNRPRLGYTFGILWSRQMGMNWPGPRPRPIHITPDHNLPPWSVGLNWPRP